MRSNFVKTGCAAAVIVGVGVGVAASFATPARADIVGQLQCNIAGSAGALITSSRTVACTFQTPGTPVQLYTGTISRLGVDIGPLTSGMLSYQVVALGAPVPGSLQGNYVGSGFGITLGTGIGLNAMIGGSGNSISLQPLSTTTSTGANFNAGLGALQLQFVGLALPPVRHVRHHHGHMHA